MRVAASINVALAAFDIGVCASAERHHNATVVRGSSPCALVSILRIRGALRCLGASIIIRACPKGRQGEAGATLCHHNANDKRYHAGNGDENPTAHGTGALFLAVTLGVSLSLFRPGRRLRAKLTLGAQNAHLIGGMAVSLAAVPPGPLLCHLTRGTGSFVPGVTGVRVRGHVA